MSEYGDGYDSAINDCSEKIEDLERQLAERDYRIEELERIAELAKGIVFHDRVMGDEVFFAMRDRLRALVAPNEGNAEIE